ncbi:MAG: lipoyl(octanoyl) transferase LipB [Thermoplasmata archaeon]
MTATEWWGRVGYPEAHRRMRLKVADRRQGRIPDTLLLVEHPAVVTVGVEGDDGSAAASGLPVVPVERGGKATYHGPGQLVGYAIVDLGARGHDVRAFVRDLESVVVRTLAAFGLRGEHVRGRPGVWIVGERKIASLGVAVEHWVTFHGFALNVDVELDAFARIHPCGFDGRIMTSMARELGRPIGLDEVLPAAIGAWQAVFAEPRTAAAPAGP